MYAGLAAPGYGKCVYGDQFDLLRCGEIAPSVGLCLVTRNRRFGRVKNEKLADGKYAQCWPSLRSEAVRS